MKKNCGIWLLCCIQNMDTQVYSQAYAQLPVGRRREVEGSTPAIRLQRPFGIIQDFPKKTQ